MPFRFDDRKYSFDWNWEREKRRRKRRNIMINFDDEGDFVAFICVVSFGSCDWLKKWRQSITWQTIIWNAFETTKQIKNEENREKL